MVHNKRVKMDQNLEFLNFQPLFWAKYCVFLIFLGLSLFPPYNTSKCENFDTKFMNIGQKLTILELFRDFARLVPGRNGALGYHFT